jgi:hypothetical protein
MSEMQKWKPDDQQREVLMELEKAVKEEGGNAEFARRFPMYRETRLSKILAALDATPTRRSYFDELKEPEAFFDEVRQFVIKLPVMRADRVANSKFKLHDFKVFQAVLTSVRACCHRSSPRRITKYIAGTGGGKTFLRRYLSTHLAFEVPFHAVEARPIWRPSSHYGRDRAALNVLRDVSAALGMDVEAVSWLPRDIREREDDIVTFCQNRVRLLFVDEAEFFHTYSLNFFKMLLNTSSVVLVIACTPKAHAKWNYQFADEAEQISRRTNAVVSLMPLMPEDVKDEASVKMWDNARHDVGLFFPANQFEQRKESLTLLVNEARRFGAFELVGEVATRLIKTPEADLAEVDKAITRTLRSMGLHRMTR